MNFLVYFGCMFSIHQHPKLWRNNSLQKSNEQTPSYFRTTYKQFSNTSLTICSLHEQFQLLRQALISPLTTSINFKYEELQGTQKLPHPLPTYLWQSLKTTLYTPTLTSHSSGSGLWMTFSWQIREPFILSDWMPGIKPLISLQKFPSQALPFLAHQST